MPETVHIEGLDQLVERCKTAGDLYREDTKRAIQDSVNLTRREIRARAKPTIGRKFRASTNVGALTGKVTPGGPVAHLVEGGTKAHQIRPKRKTVMAWGGSGAVTRTGRSAEGPSTRSTVFARMVRHPGEKAQPFVAPAVAAATPQIEKNFQDLAAKLTERIAG